MLMIVNNLKKSVILMNNWSHKTIGNTQMMPAISKNVLQNYS